MLTEANVLEILRSRLSAYYQIESNGDDGDISYQTPVHGIEDAAKAIMSLQAPAEPKPVPKRNPERRTLQHGIAHGLGSTRYYFTADRILHEDRRKAHLQEPTAPSDVEAQTEVANYCSACGDGIGEFTKHGCQGFDKHELGKSCPFEQAQQAQVADREALADWFFYNLPAFEGAHGEAAEKADALLSSGLIRPAPTREQIIAWCRDRFGAESAEAVAEDISSSLISPSPKASSAEDR